MISEIIIDTIREFDCYFSIYDRVLLDNFIDKTEMISIAEEVNKKYKVVDILDNSFIVNHKNEDYVVIFDRQLSNGEPYLEVSKFT